MQKRNEVIPFPGHSSSSHPASSFLASAVQASSSFSASLFLYDSFSPSACDIAWALLVHQQPTSNSDSPSSIVHRETPHLARHTKHLTSALDQSLPAKFLSLTRLQPRCFPVPIRVNLYNLLCSVFCLYLLLCFPVLRPRGSSYRAGRYHGHGSPRTLSLSIDSTCLAGSTQDSCSDSRLD